MWKHVKECKYGTNIFQMGYQNPNFYHRSELVWLRAKIYWRNCAVHWKYKLCTFRSNGPLITRLSWPALGLTADFMSGISPRCVSHLFSLDCSKPTVPCRLVRSRVPRTRKMVLLSSSSSTEATRPRSFVYFTELSPSSCSNLIFCGRSPTSHGTPMIPGLSALCPRTTSCRLNEMLLLQTTWSHICFSGLADGWKHLQRWRARGYWWPGGEQGVGPASV